ncbi:MAG TPA: alpha-glucuronidase family glycosyl hydrolase, partial [Pirellulales bacterium]|nr:alpha-glucuronidase family glycosyl hydrolase [Pirellulales bacterium]
MWLSFSICSSPLSAGPHVDIIVGPQAPKLERFAAEELAAQLTKLYAAEAAVVEKAPAGDAPLVLVGSPMTNPAVKQAAGDGWPKLSDQGHLLRSAKLHAREALLVGGGSPRATLWAAYELGHRLGVRYLLSGDVYPAEPGELKLSGYDLVLEPSLKDRTWVGMGAEPIGLSAWGLEDQKRLLGQLAKLKFNRVVLRFEPWQPFVDFECHGVHKRTAQLWQRESWPIDGETPGRAAFHGAKEFTNPDFAGKTDYEAKTKAGIALARGVLERASELGMTTGIEVIPFAFPSEFAKTLASQPVEDSGGLA